MRIRMLVDALGADDGFTVRSYLAGAVYPQPGMPCGDDLARTFIAGGQAVDADAAGTAAGDAPTLTDAAPTFVSGAVSAPAGGMGSQNQKAAPVAKSGRRVKG